MYIKKHIKIPTITGFGKNIDEINIPDNTELLLLIRFLKRTSEKYKKPTRRIRKKIFYSLYTMYLETEKLPHTPVARAIMSHISIYMDMYCDYDDTTKPWRLIDKADDRRIGIAIVE